MKVPFRENDPTSGIIISEIIYRGIGNGPTVHALASACTGTHNQQMYACTQIGQLSLQDGD